MGELVDVDRIFAFEPRALWDMVTVDAIDPSTQSTEQIIALNSEKLYNSQRWPITIDRISFAPINYLLKRFEHTGGVAPFGYAAASNVFLPRATISMRLRSSISKQPVVVSMEANTPSWPGGPSALDTVRFWSSRFGYCFYRFPKIMELPQDGNVQFDLSVFDGVTTAGPPAPVARARWATAFHEILRNDLRLGAARVFEGILSGASNPSQSPYGAVISPIGTAPGNFTSAATFPPEHALRPREFNAQSPIASNSLEETRISRFYGISCAIDQLDYDDNVEAALTAAGFGGFQPCPLALRVGVKARTRAAGTQTYWWRDGLPLALALPEQTPAMVHRLARPITVAPGDQLEVELRIPPQQLITVGGQSQLAEATYSLAVAFNGWAAIQG